MKTVKEVSDLTGSVSGRFVIMMKSVCCVPPRSQRPDIVFMTEDLLKNCKRSCSAGNWISLSGI